MGPQRLLAESGLAICTHILPSIANLNTCEDLSRAEPVCHIQMISGTELAGLGLKTMIPSTCPKNLARQEIEIDSGRM